MDLKPQDNKPTSLNPELSALEDLMQTMMGQSKHDNTLSCSYSMYVRIYLILHQKGTLVMIGSHLKRKEHLMGSH